VTTATGGQQIIDPISKQDSPKGVGRNSQSLEKLVVVDLELFRVSMSPT